MYLIDTNVIPELRKAKLELEKNPVVDWAKSVPVSDLYVSAISIFELERDILLVEKNNKVQGGLLRQWFDKQFLEAFKDRTIAINSIIAQKSAKLHAASKLISERDALICASALVHSMVLVTKNVNDFKIKRLQTFNPWEFKNE
jgi:predicted nucleic acid-binding protein